MSNGGLDVCVPVCVGLSKFLQKMNSGLSAEKEHSLLFLSLLRLFITSLKCPKSTFKGTGLFMWNKQQCMYNQEKYFFMQLCSTGSLKTRNSVPKTKTTFYSLTRTCCVFQVSPGGTRRRWTIIPAVTYIFFVVCLMWWYQGPVKGRWPPASGAWCSPSYRCFNLFISESIQSQ